MEGVIDLCQLKSSVINFIMNLLEISTISWVGFSTGMSILLLKYTRRDLLVFYKLSHCKSLFGFVGKTRYNQPLK